MATLFAVSQIVLALFLGNAIVGLFLPVHASRGPPRHNGVHEHNAVLHGLGEYRSEQIVFTGGISTKRDVAPTRQCSPDGTVCMDLVRNADGSTTGVATLTAYIEETLLLKLSNLNNSNVTDMSGRRLPLKYQTILDRRLPGEPAKVINVFQVRPLAPGKYSFTFRFFYHVGSYLARHNISAMYRFPFSGIHKISQGYNGGFSHKNAQIYAVDIKLPVGTPIYAPRGGIVAIAVDSNNRSKFEPGLCPEPVSVKCRAPGSEDNNIIIRYDDGTYGYMAHLQYHGIVTPAGTVVKAGQLIAHSGNTGFSKGPHLHLMVNRALSYKDDRRWFFLSVKVEYMTASGKCVIPEKGQFYNGPGLAR